MRSNNDNNIDVTMKLKSAVMKVIIIITVTAIYTVYSMAVSFIQ